MGTLFEKNIDPTVPTASILENIDPEAVKQQPNQLLNWAMFIIFQELCYITKGYSICSRCFPKISTSEGCFPAGFAPAAQRPAPARLRSRSRRNGPKMGRWGSRRQDPWKRLKNCVWFYGISWDFMRFHEISWLVWGHHMLILMDFHGIFNHDLDFGGWTSEKQLWKDVNRRILGLWAIAI